MNRAVFLDRDGVLNRAFVREGKSYPPQSIAEFSLLPGVIDATHLLKECGFKLIVVTNQPDVGRRQQSQKIVEEMHAKLFKELPLDDIEVCYNEYSASYKPLPGMLLNAAEKHRLELDESYMIGDRWRDIDAGKAAGCYTILINNNYAESLREQPHYECDSLLESARFIMEREQ